MTRSKYKLGRAPTAPSTRLRPQSVLNKNWVDGWINGWTDILKKNFFFAMPCGMWDLSVLSRDRTHTPCIGSMES